MILDTNALSALAAREAGLVGILSSASRISTTLISLGEYAFGMAGSSKKAELQGWLDGFLQRAEVLSPNLETLEFYAEVRHELKVGGTPIPANDCWIAALVRQHDLPIVSKDAHFDRVVGIRRLEW